MILDTRIVLFLMGELVAALRANDPDAFKGLLSGGVQDLGGQWWRNCCWTGSIPS